MFHLAAHLAGAALAADLLDISDRVSTEICVEVERPRRASAEAVAVSREDALEVPVEWARARDALGNGQRPTGAFDPSAFVRWLPGGDPAPSEDAVLSVAVETAPHPTDPGRMLARVGLRTPEPRDADRDPIHLVILVSVAHSMRSVPTRSIPVLQDQLPDRAAASFWYPKVDRLALAREAIREAVPHLPPGSLLGIAAFDQGATLVLPPTSAAQTRSIAAAIDGLQPGSATGGRGLDVVASLVRRMRSFCGDTRVVVISDGPTGLGGDPDEALIEVADQAVHGVTVSTLATGTGPLPVPQLEQLAWVGYGHHHRVATLSDAVTAFRTELAEPGWVARDVRLSVRFDPTAVAEVREYGDTGASWYAEGLSRGDARGGLYELTLADGVDTDALFEVAWEAGSPVEGEWTRSGLADVRRGDVPESFDTAPAGVRLAWVAARFAETLSGADDPGFDVLYQQALAARRDGERGDVELLALIDRASRLDR